MTCFCERVQSLLRREIDSELTKSKPDTLLATRTETDFRAGVNIIFPLLIDRYRIDSRTLDA